ncbi:MAG: 2-dehydro-3-deoxyphosphogluconate aldolase, partial [Solirubrobacteraceae bacterium]
LTATEVMAAWRAGAAAVKLFPAATVGPRYLEHLRAPLAHIPLLPTGGIELADVDRFLRAGAIAVGVGGPLLGDAAQGGSLSELACRARTFVNAAEAAGA